MRVFYELTLPCRVVRHNELDTDTSHITLPVLGDKTLSIPQLASDTI